MLPAIRDPKPHAKKQRRPPQQDGIIHLLRRRSHKRRPHGKEAHYDGIEDRDDGDGDAGATQAEGAPGELVVRGGEALVQHDAGGEDEGGVVARDDEGDEGVETDGGADVYEAQEEVDDCCYADCAEGEGGALVDLVGGLLVGGLVLDWQVCCL